MNNYNLKDPEGLKEALKDYERRISFLTLGLDETLNCLNLDSSVLLAYNTHVYNPVCTSFKGYFNLHESSDITFLTRAYYSLVKDIIASKNVSGKLDNNTRYIVSSMSQAFNEFLVYVCAKFYPSIAFDILNSIYRNESNDINEYADVKHRPANINPNFYMCLGYIYINAGKVNYYLSRLDSNDGKRISEYCVLSEGATKTLLESCNLCSIEDYLRISPCEKDTISSIEKSVPVEYDYLPLLRTYAIEAMSVLDYGEYKTLCTAESDISSTTENVMSTVIRYIIDTTKLGNFTSLSKTIDFPKFMGFLYNYSIHYINDCVALHKNVDSAIQNLEKILKEDPNADDATNKSLEYYKHTIEIYDTVCKVINDFTDSLSDSLDTDTMDSFNAPHQQVLAMFNENNLSYIINYPCPEDYKVAYNFRKNVISIVEKAAAMDAHCSPATYEPVSPWNYYRLAKLVVATSSLDAQDYMGSDKLFRSKLIGTSKLDSSIADILNSSYTLQSTIVMTEIKSSLSGIFTKVLSDYSDEMDEEPEKEESDTKAHARITIENFQKSIENITSYTELQKCLTDNLDEMNANVQIINTKAGTDADIHFKENIESILETLNKYEWSDVTFDKKPSTL